MYVYRVHCSIFGVTINNRKSWVTLMYSVYITERISTWKKLNLKEKKNQTKNGITLAVYCAMLGLYILTYTYHTYCESLLKWKKKKKLWFEIPVLVWKYSDMRHTYYFYVQMSVYTGFFFPLSILFSFYLVYYQKPWWLCYYENTTLHVLSNNSGWVRWEQFCWVSAITDVRMRWTFGCKNEMRGRSKTNCQPIL